MPKQRCRQKPFRERPCVNQTRHRIAWSAFHVQTIFHLAMHCIQRMFFTTRREVSFTSILDNGLFTICIWREHVYFIMYPVQKEFCNCWMNRKVEKFWVPRLRNALRRTGYSWFIYFILHRTDVLFQWCAWLFSCESKGAFSRKSSSVPRRCPIVIVFQLTA